ncbi:hypothetical protein AB5N19_02967 [Seiridium cardinale]
MAAVHRVGLTQLSADDDDSNKAYRVNIILVHGLRGHPQRTWEDNQENPTTDGRTTPSKRKHRLKTLFKSDRSSGTNKDTEEQGESSTRKVFWPRDYLVPDLPVARVWTYGYNADVIGGIFEGNNQNSVSQHGRDLQAKLERDLDNRDPIIFVAHSLGGIILKDALRRSETCRSRTKLVVFLGTPHQGSPFAGWGLIASNLAKAVLQASNQAMLRALEVNAEVLDNIHDEFLRLVPREGIRIHSFQEAKGLTGIAGLSGKVVDGFSSKTGLPTEKVETIDANHMQIARCKDRGDEQYRSIFGVLREFIRKEVVELSVATEHRAAQNTHSRIAEGTATPAMDAASHANSPVYQISLSRNRNFVGRSEIFETIRGRLFGTKTDQKLAVVGLGGVGKTQLALHVAYWVKDHIPDFSVVWLPVVSQSNFEQAYVELARRMNIEKNAADEDVKDSVRRFLESDRRKWFLVIDNADDMNVLHGSTESNGGISRYLPNTENCVVLFTTRSMDVAVSVTSTGVVDLDEMGLSESTDFLTKSLIRKDLLRDQQTIEQLLQELSYLPLAIAQAAAYLNRNKHLSIQRYLELLRGTEQDMISLLSREFEDLTRYRGSRNAVATTWLVSFDQIQEIDRPASDLLSFLSCIESKAIPRSILPLTSTEEAMENAIGTLCGYTFLVVREDGETFDMHRLVHMAARIWIRQHDRLERATFDAISHINGKFPFSDPKDRKLWRVYLPHAIRLLGENNGTPFQDTYDLSYRVGACLREDRRFRESIKYFTAVYEYRRANLPEDNLGRLSAEYGLASAYLNDSQIKKAVEMLEHVVSIESQTLAEKDNTRLSAEHALAGAYLADMQIEKAIDIYRHIVDIRSRTLDEEDQARLASEHELARAYCLDRQFEKAVGLLEHVVDVRRRSLDEEDYDRLVSENQLAVAYINVGRNKEAVAILEYVVEVEARVLNEEDPSRLNAKHTLAAAYRKNGRIKEAIAILEQVVEVRSQILQETHRDRLTSQLALGSAYLEGGRIKEAIAILEHVVEVRSQILQETHRDRLTSQHRLARAYLEDCRAGDAIRLLQHVAAVDAKILPEDDPDRVLSVDLLKEAQQALEEE